MAISDSTQTLGGAFSFGILLQAATAALLLYFKGHGSTILKERRRLVLVIFLLSAFMWSQFDFLNFLIPQQPAGKLNICQITIIVSSTFDQIARVTIGGFLLWSVGHTTKSLAEKYGLGALMGIRVMAGGFFVAFTRPQFKPVCVARSSLLPASITVLALDGIIIGILTIRVFTLGLLKASREPIPSTSKTQSKSLMLCTLGFVIWTGTSVTMILGFDSLILILRTAIPATGLMILVSIVTLFPGALLLPREDDSTTPEARSPFAAPPSRSGESFSSQSPIVPRTYTKGNLFVVNPSNTPNDSPIVRLARAVEDHGSRKYGGNTTITQMEIDDSGTMDRNMKHTSSGIFGTILAAPLSVAGKAYQNQAINMPNATVSTTITSSPLDQSRSIPRSPPRKKGIFGRSNSPSEKGVRKMGISAPIVIDVDTNSVGPFARMQTVDLATAAASERERREGNAARQLVANRPAPQPPKLAGPEGLQKSISTRRKEIKSKRPPPMPMASIAQSNIGSDGGLSVNANASSTSASLSPGIEDIRRRSPRNSKAYDQGLDQFDFSDVSRGRVRTQIRTDPPPDSRRQNPLRSQIANQETVMYIKDIVYDQPSMVKSIISGVPAMIAKSKQPSSPPRTPRSSTSILNRPRPYKRETEKDGPFFAGTYSPRHRRSKSGSSITNNRKSIMRSKPGSPTGLPALPPLPTSASRLKRLLPNDTRSMTVDEKILLLFPAPSEIRPIQQRRSSVPSIPRIPSLILQGSGLGFSDEVEQADHRASKRTTISFGAPPDLKQFSPNLVSPANKEQDDDERNANLDVVEKPRKDSNTYRFSAHTYGNLVEGSHDSWAAKFPIPGVPNFPEANWKSAFTETSSDSGDTHDDSKSMWASLHSPVPAIEIQGVRANTIQMHGDSPMVIDTSRELPALPLGAEKEFGYNADPNAEFITFALATEGSTTGDNLPSFFLDASPGFTDEEIFTPVPTKTWHHRLGDELPTFSDRRKEFRTRAMPPPPPLLLNSSGRQATVVVKEPEPEIIDSPERAIKQIQAQLKMFEGDNKDRDSLGSLLGHLPGPPPKTPSGANADRLGLLANLEAEMGQQETHWMQMQHNFDRDSNSVMILSPAVQELREKGHASPPPEPRSRSNSPPSRSSSTRSITLRSRRSTATLRSTESSSSENSRASIWQQRLAEAQMEFMENAPELLQKRNLNFFTLQKSLPQPGSPTPPDSVDSADDSTQFDSDSETEDSDEPTQTKPIRAPLWESKALSPPIVVGHMWTAPHSSSRVHEASPEPPAKSVRPAMRKTHHPLTVTSLALWSVPEKSTSHIPRVGLWGSRLSRPRSIVTRPKTQRPQRKSRRVTFLPDIVESPSPLPNKRDTLGIFQFPWGEKSDNAVYRPAPMPSRNLQVPNMLNSSLDARSRMLEQEEYESSFFDDYDDIEEQDSDDDFDESTLWEIANLLKSRDVPSKNSLLPSARIIEDYDDSGDSDEEVAKVDQPSQTQARPSVVKFLPIQPLKMASSPREPLWLEKEDAPSPPAKDTDLPKSETQTSKAAESTIRSKSRDTLTLQALTSGEMWETPGVDITLPEQLAATLWGSETETKQDATPRVSSLWASEKQTTTERSPTLNAIKLWLPEAQTPASSNELWRIDDVTEKMPLQRIPLRTSSKSSLPALYTKQIESNVMWDKAITAVTGITAAKKATSLWTQQPQAPTISGTMTSAKLWTARERKLITEAAGLFMTGLQRTDFRSSEKAPAALETIRKPRTAVDALSTLNSQALWAPIKSQVQKVEGNWMSNVSARPSNPSALTTYTSSDMLTPNSNKTSVASASTTASSLWNAELLTADAKSPAWWESQNATSAMLPHVDVQEYISKLPMRAPSKRAHSARLSVLASSDLWERKAPSVDNALQGDSWLMSKIAVVQMEKPVKESARKYPATKSQWEAALAEAVQKSAPRVQRPSATPAEWKAALEAAIPRESQRSEFDAAVRHPVFFTSSMKTLAHYVHPAMEGYVQPHAKSSVELWSRLPTSPIMTGHGTPLWNAQAAVKTGDSSALFTDQSSTPRVKTVSKVLVPLPVLQSTSFWQPPTTTVVVTTHWLHVAKVAKSQLWNRATPPILKTKVAQSLPLWTSESAERLNLFTNHVSQALVKSPSKASVAAALPVLSSTKIWQQSVPASTAVVEAEPRHWLHETSISPNNGEEEQRIREEEEEENERIKIEQILNSGPSVWLQPPRHTLKIETISRQDQAELRELVPSMPTVPVQTPLVAVATIPTSSPTATPVDALSSLMADLSRASINSPFTLVTADQTTQPQLKRTQTLAPTGRKSVWTAPVRSSTISVSTGRRGSALWDGNNTNAYANSNYGQNSQLGSQRLSRRMSGAAEEQQVAEAKSKIEAEGQKTWRPKWGLPEKPTDWLNGAGKRSSRVDFRY